MSATSSILISPPTLDDFPSRCARLRLLSWEFDPQGIQLTQPALPDRLQTLFSASAFTLLLHQTAIRFLAATDASPPAEEIAPGLWVFPILLKRRSRNLSLTLVLGFEPAFGDSTLLQQLAYDSGLSLSEARLACVPFIRGIRLAAADIHETLRWSHADLLTLRANRATMNEFSTNLAQAYEQVNLVFRLGRYLNFIQDPVQLVHLLLEQIHQILPFTWVAIRCLPSGKTLPAISDALMLHGHSSHQSELDLFALSLLKTCNADRWTKILTPDAHPLAATLRSEIFVDPILHDQQVIGVLMAGNKTGDDPDIASTDLQLLSAIASFFGVFHENIARFSEQRGLFLGTLNALISAIDAKDPYTRGHSDRVALLAAQTARALNMPDKTVEQYRIAGLVHDVGKIGVPESVLCKAGALTDDEFAQIKKHPRIGFDILGGIAPMVDILPGVLHHHERWDGRGYPDGVAGENIELIARVLALADTFDAMSSHRAYRASRPREVVFAEIQRNSGTQFDPSIVPTFLALDFTEFDIQLAKFQ